MDFAAGVMLTLVSTTTTDDGLGNTTTTTTETPWGPCAVWDRFATESSDPRVAPVVVGLDFAGPRIGINSDDQIRYDGDLYEVDGLPQTHLVSPFTGWDPGIVVPVKRAGSV